jgi:hypothetical protein
MLALTDGYVCRQTCETPRGGSWRGFNWWVHVLTQGHSYVCKYPPPYLRQGQKLDVAENLRLLRDWKPRGRRRGAMRYHLRMRLPFAIFVLDDGREVLVDRRNRPLIERAPCRAIGVPARVSKAEMWERQRSAIYLDNPIDQLPATEDERTVRAEAALRYFGLAPGDPEGGSR